MMKPVWKGIWVLLCLALTSDVRAGGFDGLLDRVGGRLGKTIEDRMGGTGDKLVGKTFDKADRAVDCAAGEEGCNVRCVATDVGCLRAAKAHGQTVDIVDEEELDVLRCEAQDRACLQRAKKLGKKVEITD